MARRLYVYYRVGPDQVADTVRAVHALQRQLCRQFAGLQAELLSRTGWDSDGSLTMMETYAATEDLPALQAALTDASAALPQPRHVEVFETLP